MPMETLAQLTQLESVVGYAIIRVVTTEFLVELFPLLAEALVSVLLSPTFQLLQCPPTPALGRLDLRDIRSAPRSTPVDREP